MTSPYDIEAKRTFHPKEQAGERMPFRSLLEARWALTFDLLGAEWEYEPAQFELPDGMRYTPDFYLEGIGYVEIKPHMKALLDVEAKLRSFARWMVDVIPHSHTARFFSIDADAPSLSRPGSQISSVVEWKREGICPMVPGEARKILCPEGRRPFEREYPDLYADHVSRVMRFTQKAHFDGPFHTREVIPSALRDFGDRALQPRDQNQLEDR